MYAVIQFGGKQYKVSEGEILEVDNLGKKVGEEVEINNVLLLANEENVLIGKPTISDVKIRAKVLENFKGKKIRVARFKAKVRYRRVKGFRPKLTKIKIEKLILIKKQGQLKL